MINYISDFYRTFFADFFNSLKEMYLQNNYYQKDYVLERNTVENIRFNSVPEGNFNEVLLPR